MAAKERHVMVNLEPIVHDAFSQLIIREGDLKGKQDSMSNYARKLIIKHLLEKEVITLEMLHDEY